VEAFGSDPQQLADQLRGQITSAEKTDWERGDPKNWAMESYGVAKSVTYTIGAPPGCTSDATPLPLPAGYEDKAKVAAALQIERAGVRLALLLNRALGGSRS
jgi:hypothetical protein